MTSLPFSAPPSALPREQNHLKVIDILRVYGQASRAEIARRAGLSRTTVSTIVGELLDRGMVVERPGADLPARDGKIGRPPILLSLNPSAAFAVGIDFDHDKLRVGVADLSRAVLAERDAPCDVDHDATGAIATAGRLVDLALADAGVDRARVLGAGVALPGPVDPATGNVHRSGVLPGWLEVDARAALQDQLEMDVFIDNDANLGALAECTTGAATGARHVAYVSISGGIGAGLTIEGHPYRGHRGLAGELGHVLVDPQGRICRCGNRGCLETMAAGPALCELLRVSRHLDLTTAELVALAKDGDAGCRRVIGDAGRVIGQALAGLVALFGPDTIVVGGDLGEAGELLLEPMRESVRRFAPPAATHELQIVPGALGDRANLLGALALVLTQTNEALAVRIAQAAAS